MKNRVLLFLVITLPSFFVYGQDDPTYEELTGGLNTVTTAVPFLMIAPDSRAGGMGDLGVATSPDVNSFHWNPAKYAFVEDKIGASVSYIPWLRALVPDINLSYMVGYFKISDEETVATELRYFSLGDIIFTNYVGDVVGQFNPHELSTGASYARKLSDNFSMAVSGRYIYSNLTGGQSAGGIPTVAGQSFSADLAAYYKSSMRIANRDIDLAFGANISNIGDKLSYVETFDEKGEDFIPINLRLGTSFGIEFNDYNKMSIGLDINKLLVPTPPVYDRKDVDGDGDTEEILYGKDPNVAVVTGMFQSFGDAPGGLKEELREINYSAGLEYWYDNQFAIRSGYFFEHNTKGGRKYFTFGAGMKYSVFQIDMSYLINASPSITGTNPLANTMRFTLVFDIGEMKESGL